METTPDYELRLHNVIFDSESRTREAVIGRLVDLLSDEGKILNAETVKAAVLAREKVRGTGLVRGVAAPHAKTAEVEGAEIALARLEHPIDFGAVDGEASRHIFLIVLNKDLEPAVSNRILARIVKCYQSQELLTLMDQAATPADYHKLLQGCYDD